jgi:nucleotide-binding universal stress UspA family protein
MRSIVVGVRGDAELDPSLDFAVEEAVRRRLPLEAVHCYEVTSYGEWPPVLQPARLREQREAADQLVAAALARAVERVPGGATADARAHVMEGDPADCLISLAPSAALMVVGTRGGGTLRRGLRGSVSAEVLHRSWAPVAIVPHTAPAVPDRWVRSRVVAALDGSPASLSALSWAVAQAYEWGSVLVPVTVSSLTGRAPVALMERTTDLAAAVWTAVREAGGQSLEVHPHFLEGSPPRALLSFVAPDDLMVTGSRGRGGATSLLMGSTSTFLAEQAACPVVVVREGQTRRETHQRARHEPSWSPAV